MPHIQLQTSANLVENTSIEQILENLVAEFCQIETVDPVAVKAFHVLSGVWVMGAGAKPGFAACTISVLAGRPEELRVKMADRMYAALQEAFSESLGAGEVNLTLEIREMEKATYRK